MGTVRYKANLGKWVFGKGASEFHDWLRHASSFWVEHMASLNENVDSSKKEERKNDHQEATNGKKQLELLG